jgi:hypothetical protein
MKRKMTSMRDLERIVLAALRSQRSSKSATSIAIEPAAIAGDWSIGPIGFDGDTPPEGYAEVVAELQTHYGLDGVPVARGKLKRDR